MTYAKTPRQLLFGVIYSNREKLHTQLYPTVPTSGIGQALSNKGSGTDGNKSDYRWPYATKLTSRQTVRQ